MANIKTNQKKKPIQTKNGFPILVEKNQKKRSYQK